MHERQRFRFRAEYEHACATDDRSRRLLSSRVFLRAYSIAGGDAVGIQCAPWHRETNLGGAVRLAKSISERQVSCFAFDTRRTCVLPPACC